MAQEVTTYQDFAGELEQRTESFASMMPTHVDPERFKANAVAAVRQTPALLKCSKRSLFGALTRSAQDGLMPDGREGVINAYGADAQWIPMTHGLRKRAREIDGIIVDAQVVHEGDDFSWSQGDDPRIEHVPAPLGTPRGQMVGAYAIFRAADGTVLHREVMDADQIGRVRGQSKQSGGLMWSKFTEEAWRKTVIRRGFKSVPVSERLAEVVRRDDDLFDFDEQPEIAPKRQPARVVQATPNGQRRPLPPIVDSRRVAEPEDEPDFEPEPDPDLAEDKHPDQIDKLRKSESEGPAPAEQEPTPPPAETGPKITAGLEDWFAQISAGATRAADLAALDDYWKAEVTPHRAGLIQMDRDAIDNLYGRHRKRLVG